MRRRTACGRPGTPCSRPLPEVPSVLASIGYAAAYTGVGIALLVLGLLRPRPADPRAPGPAHRRAPLAQRGDRRQRGFPRARARSSSPASGPTRPAASAWRCSTPSSSASSGVVLQAVAFLALDLLIPGKLGQHLDGARVPPRQPDQRRRPAGRRGDHRRLDLALTDRVTARLPASNLSGAAPARRRRRQPHTTSKGTSMTEATPPAWPSSPAPPAASAPPPPCGWRRTASPSPSSTWTRPPARAPSRRSRPPVAGRWPSAPT